MRFQNSCDCRFPYLCIRWLQTQEHVLNLSRMTVLRAMIHNVAFSINIRIKETKK